MLTKHMPACLLCVIDLSMCEFEME